MKQIERNKVFLDFDVDFLAIPIGFGNALYENVTVHHHIDHIGSIHFKKG